MSSQWDFYFSNVNNSLASIFVDLGLQKICAQCRQPMVTLGLGAIQSSA
jgi:DNA-directed RNA polymerase subunit N (RpoN/RPB10)